MARQFDVFRTAQDLLVVVVQSDLLEAMRTRVVMPMLPEGRAGPVMRVLNPVVAIGDERVAVIPQLMATLTIAELGNRVGSVAHKRDDITRALDALLSGV